MHFQEGHRDFFFSSCSHHSLSSVYFPFIPLISSSYIYLSFLTGNGREKLPYRILNTAGRKKKLPFQVIQMQRVQDLHKMSQLLREIIIVIFTRYYLCAKSYTEESYSTPTYSYSMCCVLCSVAQSCSTLRPHGLQPAMGILGTVARHALLQAIFPAQGSNPGLLHCRWILYHLSHQGSPALQQSH